MNQNEFIPPKDGEIIAFGRFRNVFVLGLFRGVESMLVGRMLILCLIILGSWGMVKYESETLFGAEKLFKSLAFILLFSWFVGVIEIWIFQLVKSEKIKNLRVIYFSEGLVITDRRQHISTEDFEDLKKRGLVLKRIGNINNEHIVIPDFIENFGNDFVFNYLTNESQNNEMLMWMRDWRIPKIGLFRRIPDLSDRTLWADKRGLVVFVPILGRRKSKELYDYLKVKEEKTIYWIP